MKIVAEPRPPVLKRLQTLNRDLAFKILWRKAHRFFEPVKDTNCVNRVCTAEEGNDFLHHAILDAKPLMATRFGSSELECIMNYLSVASFKQRPFLIRFFSSLKNKYPPFWDDTIRQNLSVNSGFFPNSLNQFEKFAQMYISISRNIDFLGYWNNYGENKLGREYFPSALYAPLISLEPYYFQSPWSRALMGKKVLVVHPFEKSIIQNFANREKLFSKNVLPDFELKTIKAVQSLGSNNESFKTWFDALDFMKEKISAIDFDVCIIGCGAYGLPLANHVKQMGKIGIHMGGATQILFGIKGKRWEENKFFSDLFNENWTRPLPEEIPLDFYKVENGCYW